MNEAAANACYPPRPADAIDAGQLKRVLVVMLRHHGDVLLTTPVFTALTATVPGVEVDALVYRETLPMVEFNPHLKQVHAIDRAWKKQGTGNQLANEWALLRRLRARRYDLVVHLTNHWRGAWLVRLLRPRWSAAPESLKMPEFWLRSFTHLYPYSVPGRHTVEQNLDALRRVGLDIRQSPCLTMVPGPAGEQDARAFMQANALEPGYILMQPTSRWMFKTWPVAQNAELIRRLLRRGEHIVLSCAPDANEHAMIDAILDQLRDLPEADRHRLKLATEGGTLNRLAALIGLARMFVGIDSAPMHIAAAMGIPSVALFGPSKEAVWRPWKVPHRLVMHAQFACRPCNRDGCGGSKRSDCLTGLPVEQVLRAMDDLQSDPALDPLALA